MIILYACDSIVNKYNAVAHLYRPYQSCVFYHIFLISKERNFCSFNNSTMHLLCAVVVSEYFLLSPEKNEQNKECLAFFLSTKLDWGC